MLNFFKFCVIIKTMIIEKTEIKIFEKFSVLPKLIKEKNNNKKIRLIVGLGNPGKKYDQTYHNIGFLFLDRLSKQLGIEIKKKQCKSLVGEGFIEREEQIIDVKTGKIENKIIREKIILAKPQTFMNLSGEAVLALIKKYKISLDEILIVLDDVDLEIGTYRYRESGSAGTHNGLRNIVSLLKSTEFKRIRIGIGKNEKIDLISYVLSKISKENLEKIEEATQRAIDHLNQLFFG